MTTRGLQPPRRKRRLRHATFAAACLAVTGMSGCVQWEQAPMYPGYERAGAAMQQGGRVPATVQVQRGDSVYAIARRYGVPMRRIIEVNALQPPYVLQPGQTLRMPARQVYTVERGDTLYGISRQVGVDMNALARANRMRPPYTIYPGQGLVLPGQVTAIAEASGRPDPEPRPPASAGPSAPPLLVDRRPTGTPAPAPTQTARVEPAPGPTEPGVPVPASKPTQVATTEPPPPPRATVPGDPPPRAASRFAWPVQGKVISGYGAAGKGLHNDGINIAVPEGTPVRAAENGVVVYAGNELKGFGNLLLLKHQDGWMTAYAHNSRLLVNRGQTIERGMVIAHAGSTGNVDRPQVHFEIRKGAKAVDPLKHMDGQGLAMAQ